MATAQSALPVETSGTLASVLTTLTYTVDLGTLPNRPALVVEATMDSPSSDVELVVEIANYVGPPTGCISDEVSPPGIGATSLERVLYFCGLLPIDWVGGSIDIRVRATSFGTASGPETVNVTIRGYTQIPTSELFSQVTTDLSTTSVQLSATRDTTIYQLNPTANNGRGDSLWVGSDLVGAPLFTFYSLRSLIGFDLEPEIPPNSTIDDVRLELYAHQVMGTGNDVSLQAVAKTPADSPWKEGFSTSSGNQFTGDSESASANRATWIKRDTDPWTMPGGDLAGAVLDTQSVSGPGYLTFVGPALDTAVQEMLSTDTLDGFLLQESLPFTFFGDQGTRFGSREDLPVHEPVLYVTYTPLLPYADGYIQTNTEPFIGEGEDFRWIYDTNDDDILVTDIGGVCEAVPFEPGSGPSVPYTYAWTGEAGYVGLDCCTWTIEAAASGTVGTGQAIFFHNLDPANNIPPDTDGDGIRDLCDNCVYVPNGPLLGTCIGGTTPDVICRSDLECGAPGTCSLSQDDADKDFTGDGCVPEPGFGLGLTAGVALLASTRRRATAY